MFKAKSKKIFTALRAVLQNRYLLFAGVLFLYAKLSANYFGLSDSQRGSGSPACERNCPAAQGCA